MVYGILAVKRANFEGFQRGGYFFSSEVEAYLSDNQMTDAIRNEPMLIVREVREEVQEDTRIPCPTEDFKACPHYAGGHCEIAHEVPYYVEDDGEESLLPEGRCIPCVKDGDA